MFIPFPPVLPCGGLVGGVFPVPPDILAAPPPPDPPGTDDPPGEALELPPPPPADVIVDEPAKTELLPGFPFGPSGEVDPEAAPPPPTVTG